MSSSHVISVVRKNQRQFHPVVPFDPGRDKLIQFDFTSANKKLNHDIVSDTKVFTAWIDGELKNNHARYGTGGYAENRTVYSASRVFDAERPGEEPRRVHLGSDIWGKPNTAVMAPLDGIVHSFAFNDRFGDYGPTVILSHMLETTTFYTLYGHLSLNSIKNLQGGEKIGKGDVFAEFGIPAENGGWPSHLHFQLIVDIGEWHGDYPGVCKLSEKEEWLANSPDPDIILQMNQFL